jgi:hypothetical protein
MYAWRWLKMPSWELLKLPRATEKKNLRKMQEFQFLPRHHQLKEARVLHQLKKLKKSSQCQTLGSLKCFKTKCTQMLQKSSRAWMI